jgi:hypothetical protein
MTEMMAYAGRKRCGCVVAACVDEPNHARDVAREIANWVRAGMTVERMTVEDVRGALHRCTCSAAPKDQATLP